MPTIVIAREDGLLVASFESDVLDEWRVDLQLKESFPRCLAMDPHRPARLFCGTFSSGAWRSEDAGYSWVWAGDGLPKARITAVAVSESEERPTGGVVYVGTEPSAVYRSMDAGLTWVERPGLGALPSAWQWSFPPRPETHHVRWIACDPTRAGRIWVAIEAGALIRSRDGGVTWEDRTEGGPLDTHTLVTHPSAPGRLYAAAGDGYFESVDAGETWRRPEEGLEDFYLWSVAVDPRDPEAVVISASQGPRQAHDPGAAESHLYRRKDGAPWRKAGKGLPGGRGVTAPVLAAHPLEPGVFYCASNLGVYRSSDAGLSWDRVPIPWPEESSRRRVHALAVVP